MGHMCPAAEGQIYHLYVLVTFLLWASVSPSAHREVGL